MENGSCDRTTDNKQQEQQPHNPTDMAPPLQQHVVITNGRRRRRRTSSSEQQDEDSIQDTDTLISSLTNPTALPLPNTTKTTKTTVAAGTTAALRRNNNHYLNNSGHHQLPSDAPAVSAGSDPPDTSGGGSSSLQSRPHHILDRIRLHHDMPVCGREKEFQLLKDAYERVSRSSSEVILLHGPSGIGKSVLVDSLRHYVMSSGFFVGGKYDQIYGGSSEPYSALVAAFTEICDLYIMQEQTERHAFVQPLTQALGSEIHVLTKLISNLSFLLHHDKGEDQENGNNRVDDDDDHFITMAQAFVRFKQLCKAFLRCAASSKHPILLFLDDLQWADEHSLEVIRALIQDDLSKHVLLVLTFREEDDQTNNYEMLLSSTKLHTTDMLLDNLDLQGVYDIVCQLMNIGAQQQTPHDDSSTMALSQVLVQKTNGNAFFLIQLLENLQDQGLLYYFDANHSHKKETSSCSTGGSLQATLATLASTTMSDSSGWQWDLDRIQSETNIAENVLELVFRRVQRLPPNLIHLLKLASSLGYHFDLDLLLEIVVSEEQDFLLLDQEYNHHDVMIMDTKRQLLEGILKHAVQENLIESTSTPRRYKFSHDRVQQCLYELIAEGEERDALHFRVGLIIWNMVIAQQEDDHANAPKNAVDDTLVFLAADHLNRGCACVDEGTRLDLAELNLRAGKLAAAKAAFFPAIEYLRTGIQWIDPSSLWDGSTYALSLDLHSSLAEAQNSCGKFTDSEETARIVLDKATCFQDKVRSYWALGTSLGSQGWFMKAAEVGFDVLRQLGEPFPRRPTLAHVGVELVRTLQVMTCKSDEQILNLPIMTNKKKIAAMNMMGRISLQVYFQYAAKNIFVLLGLRMIRLSCKYGLTHMSPFALSNYAVILSVSGLHNVAYRYGKLSLRMMEILEARDTEARTLAMLNHFVMHWRRPLPVGLMAFQRAYHIGMETGDLEFAFAGAIGHAAFMFYAAKSVADVYHETTEVIKLLVDFHHGPAGILLRPCAQISLNLMGLAENPTVLTGDVMVEEELAAEILQENNAVLSYYLPLMRLHLAYFFESLPLMQQLLRRVDRMILATRGHFTQYTSLFFCALCYYILYRENGNIWYRQRARTIVRVMRRWTRRGCMNTEPFYHLLEAERLSLSCSRSLKRQEATKKAYEEAIQVAVRNGSIIFQAMCHERGALALAQHMPAVASHYMRKSIALWNQWDARGKAEMLQQKYSHILFYNDDNTKPQIMVVTIDDGEMDDRDHHDEISLDHDVSQLSR